WEFVRGAPNDLQDVAVLLRANGRIGHDHRMNRRRKRGHERAQEHLGSVESRQEDECWARVHVVRGASAELLELLGQSDDDALGATDVTEPVRVLILDDFAYELSAMGAQPREDVLDVVDGEHDAAYAERVHWCVLRLTSDRRRRVEL